jgi:hypothetical protein
MALLKNETYEIVVTVSVIIDANLTRGFVGSTALVSRQLV